MHSVQRPLLAPATPLRVILLLAFALRVIGLGAQSLWYDEAVSIFIARKAPADLIAHTAGDIHPPLYYLLLHWWLALVGSTEFAAGFLSLFFGVLLVALACRMARDWFGDNAAVLCAFLVAVSSFNLWYSQEVRMYTLAACIALLSVRLMAELWETGFDIRRRRFWVMAAAYAVTMAAGLYTHYYLGFLWVYEVAVLVFLILLGVLRQPEKVRNLPPTNRERLRTILTSRLALWLYVQVAVLALFSPWFSTAVRQTTDPPVPPWRSPVTWIAAISESTVALIFGPSVPRENPTSDVLAILLAVAATAGAVLWHWRFRQKPAGVASPGILAGATLAPLFLILALSAIAPLYHVRYLFLFSAAAYVFLSAGLVALGRRGALAVVMAAGIIAGGSALAEYSRRAMPVHAKDDYRSAAAHISSRALDGDAVLVNSGYIYPAFVYYYDQPIAWRGRLGEMPAEVSRRGVVIAESGSLSPTKSLGWGSPTSDFFAMDEESTRRALDRLLELHPRLWVLRANDTVNDPNGFIRDYLSRNAVLFDDTLVKGESYVRAQGYLSLRAQPVDFAMNTISATLGNRISLIGWQSPATITAGSQMDLALLWQAVAPMDVDYHVSVGLYDSKGRQWASADGVPVGPHLLTGDWKPLQVLPDRWSLAVPMGAPPGNYSVQVTAYDPATQKPLTTPAGAQGTRARLGTVTLVRSAANGAGWWEMEPAFGDGIALADWKVSEGPIKPGEAIHVELLWRTLASHGEDLVVALQLTDERGRQRAIQESAPTDGLYAASQWTRGELISDIRDLLVPADVPDGRYRLGVSVYATRARERLPVRDGFLPFTRNQQEIASVEVHGREHVMKPPATTGIPAHVRFGDNARLVGYNISTAPPTGTRGGTLTVTLYWQAMTPPNTNQKVFVHVVGADQQIVAQRDSEPGDGALPMTGWLEGEYLTDVTTIPLRADLPRDNYNIYIGIYDARTTARLPIVEDAGKAAGDRWLLATLALP